jgi:hypothetical protein
MKNKYLFNCSSLMSLDTSQTLIKTIPNNYVFQLKNILDPTEYQSVIANEFVRCCFHRLFLFVRYRFMFSIYCRLS